jgi:general secretion pathway protein J
MTPSRGFTLIEMVVAIAIFAVIATISYASLNRFLDSSELLETEIRELRQLEKAFTMLARDMRFVSSRSVRDEYGDPEPVLMVNNPNVAGELLRLTTQQLSISLPGSSTLQRTAYRFDGDRLVRVRWKVLDRDEGESETRQTVIGGIENASVSLVQGEVAEVESLLDVGVDQQLPDGIEWTITLDNGRQYRRVFEVRHAIEG